MNRKKIGSHSRLLLYVIQKFRWSSIEVNFSRMPKLLKNEKCLGSKNCYVYIDGMKLET